MAAMVEVILVEDSLSQRALACIAIALRRPGTQVAEVCTLPHAAALIRTHPGKPSLVILGWRALQHELRPFMNALGKQTRVVGLASNVGRAARKRALCAGLHGIYEPPAEWGEYAALLKDIVEDGCARVSDRSDANGR